MAPAPHLSIAFKRQVAQEFLAGEVGLFELAKRHDICRNLLRVRIEKYERGEFDSEMEAANLLEQYEARITAGRIVATRFGVVHQIHGPASINSLGDLTAYPQAFAVKGLIDS